MRHKLCLMVHIESVCTVFSQCTDTCSRYVSTTIENEIESPTTIPSILQLSYCNSFTQIPECLIKIEVFILKNPQ